MEEKVARIRYRVCDERLFEEYRVKCAEEGGYTGRARELFSDADVVLEALCAEGVAPLDVGFEIVAIEEG